MVAVIAAVVGVGVVAALQVGKSAVAVPLLQADLQIDLAAAGWVTGVFALLGLVGGIPAGSLIARAGDRRMLVLGLAAIAAGSAAGAMAPGFAVLIATRILEGFGFLLISVAGPAVLQRVVAAERRDAAFAVWSCFMPAGMALALLAGPLFDGWRILWWAGAALGLAGVVVTLAVVPAGAAAVARPGGGAWDVLRARGPLALAACFALYNLMFFSLFAFLPVLLMQRLGVGPGLAAPLGALVTAANIVGNLAAGGLIGRGVGRAPIVSVACIAMALAALGIFLPAFGPVPTFILCVLFSGIGGLIPATLLSAAPAAVPAALAPIAVGLVMQGSNLGQVVGPAAVGGAIELFGWPAAAGMVIAAAVVAVVITRRD